VLDLAAIAFHSSVVSLKSFIFAEDKNVKIFKRIEAFFTFIVSNVAM
jgi:hypothetical protein